MKGKLKQTKGITLVALVITIIILLILAVVSIRLVMNDGIIEKAEQGVNEYSEAEEDEQAQLLKAEYEMAKYEGKAKGTFADYVLQTKYNGVKVGDIVEYNAKSNGVKTYTPNTANGAGSLATSNSTTGKYDLTTEEYTTEDLTWRVLGVNSNGQIELISTTTNKKLCLANEEGYIHGPDELDTFCKELYGQGKHAVKESTRSVTVEDINKITGYDPKTYSGYGTTYKYRFGPTYYGSTLNTQPQYSANGGTTWQNTTFTNSKFRYCEDGSKEFKNLEEQQALTEVTLTSTLYVYQGASKLEQTSAEYMMLFNNTGWGEGAYWLASHMVGPKTTGSSFGFGAVYQGSVTSNRLIEDVWYYLDVYGCGVRAVVTLESDIQLSGNSTDGWTIN